MPDNNKISVTIDGHLIEVPSGILIVEAAKKLGITIPTFCYDERLRSVGACRMCLVDVEKSSKLVASCATPVTPNMVVHTQNERVIKARKGVLEFLLINHPLDCPTCDKGGECPLQDLTYSYGPPTTRYKEDKIRFIPDINQKFDDIPLGPEILLCRNRCIMCYKCVRIVRELAGEADLGSFQRGAFANIGVLNEVEFADEFSGNTVEYCPVGALTSRSFRYKIRNWLLKKSPSVCNLCSDGCNISVEGSHGSVYRYMSRRNDAIDDGWLCDRGRYSFDINGSENRLRQPHIRRDGSLKACSYDEALALLAKHFGSIIDTNKGSEVAAIGSPMLSNEEAYSIRDFLSNVIKSSNVDFQSEYANPLETDILDMIGLDGAIADLEQDTAFVFVGIDPAVEHPVAALRIKKAVAQNSAKAVFIGSNDKRLGHFPATNIRIPYGAEPEYLKLLINNLGNIAQIPNDIFRFDINALNDLTRLLRESKRIHVISGLSFFHHPNRAALFSALLALKQKAKCRLSILPPQANFMGVSHFGLYGGIENSFNAILEKINSGEIKTMMLFGSNPLDEYPDRRYVKDTLKKLEFLIVVSPFMTSTASIASLVLPQALLPDYEGTLVNIEGRLQLFQPMVELSQNNYKPVWSIIGEISELMGIGNVWYSSHQVRTEIAKNLKGMESLAEVAETGILLNFKNTELAPAEISSKPLPGPSDEFPYLLQLAHSVHHPNWLTQYSENLMRINSRQNVWVHPDDAAREGIIDGQIVRVGSADTAINIPAVISKHVNKGEILIVNSFGENQVNRLLNRNMPANYVALRKG